MKPVFTKEGKETVKNFIAELTALQKEILDVRKDAIGETEIPTEDDILQDIFFFEEAFSPENCNYYPATENYGLWLSLEKGVDYIWE